MSDTPETDAQLTTFTSISKLKKRFNNRTGPVSADFARKLERERDQARISAAYFKHLKDIYKSLAKAPDREATRVAPPRAAGENASWGNLEAEKL
jgi:hypothetical protein